VHVSQNCKRRAVVKWAFDLHYQNSAGRRAETERNRITNPEMSKTQQRTTQTTTTQQRLDDRDKHQQLRDQMHGPTQNGSGCDRDSLSRFLLLVEADTEIAELPELYQTFREELEADDV